MISFSSESTGTYRMLAATSRHQPTKISVQALQEGCAKLHKTPQKTRLKLS